jgi:hypothetical protein
VVAALWGRGWYVVFAYSYYKYLYIPNTWERQEKEEKRVMNNISYRDDIIMTSIPRPDVYY